MARAAQLSLSELDPDAVHGHGQVFPQDEGYRQRCLCGWVSGEHRTSCAAHNSVSAHLARTVQGTLLCKTLRKP